MLSLVAIIAALPVFSGGAYLRAKVREARGKGGAARIRRMSRTLPGRYQRPSASLR